jgi:hypothetical protein
VDEPGVGRTKAAGIEVEPRQLGIEVDVQPLAAGGLGVLRGKPDRLRSDARTLMCAVRLRVDEEGVAPPSVATLTKPISRPSASRAVTQPRLCGRMRSHQPACAFPPCDSTSSTISASANGPRQPNVTDSSKRASG